jgi:hypothetical protein
MNALIWLIAGAVLMLVALGVLVVAEVLLMRRQSVLRKHYQTISFTESASPATSVDGSAGSPAG